MEKRVRSRYFVVSGGLGGIAGFLLMEIVTMLSGGSGSRTGNILGVAIYFAGFGLAVGAALGMTEGYVQKNRKKITYGLTMGLILGVVGGFIGGAAGQTIFGLVPMKYASQSSADLAVALDSSTSMKALFVFGNDPHGERRRAAKNLVDRLSPGDRIAVVDFDGAGSVVYPLTALDSSSARDTAKAAIDRIDDWGDTNLSAGLDVAINELVRNKQAERSQYLIFLTDGQGLYDNSSAERAKQAGITIYTIGLGSDVSADLLTGIAQQTGGQYFPVADASKLSLLFEKILTENIGAMTTQAGGTAAPGGTPLTSPWVFLILRVLSWAVMGLAIGLGQGVRENTREDLRACALGGLLGGAIGGALFDPVANLVSLGAGLVGRGLADLVVGACIGGSMRLAQQHMVAVEGKETTTLLSILPQKGGLVVIPEPDGRVEKPVPAPVVPLRPVAPPPQAAPVPVPVSRPAAVSRPSLAGYQEKYGDRSQAMAMAYKSGDFTLKEIAEHFGVQSTTVKRAAEQFAGR
jgi:hypothetical protein